MSHTVKLKVALTNQEAIRRACVRMDLAPPVVGSTRLYENREVHGTSVTLPGWRYPVVITSDGTVAFDNFNGHWGSMSELDHLAQYYTVESARMQAEENGYEVSETMLSDKSIELAINTPTAYEYA